MALLALTALGISLFSAPRNNSVFAVGLRSAQGSPVERALPEPPDWKQFVALAALRRSQELDRLLRSEEHTSELQSLRHLVCRLLLEKKKKTNTINTITSKSTRRK